MIIAMLDTLVLPEYLFQASFIFSKFKLETVKMLYKIILDVRWSNIVLQLPGFDCQMAAVVEASCSFM